MKLGTFAARLLSAVAVFSALSLTSIVAHAEDQGSDVLADVGGHKITRSELEQHSSEAMNRARAQLQQAHLGYYEAERTALQKEIDKQVLTQEAARQHITPDELLKREISDHIKDPPDEVMKIYYLGIPTPKEPYEEMRPRILHSIRTLEERQAADEYVKRLRSKETIKVSLQPPRQQVTVGDTTVSGPADAPVTLIEFADYQCPYCRQEEPALKRLREQFKDKVRYSYRDYPLPMHPYARKAAEAARCAGAQGQYWPYHDKLFAGGPDDLAVPGLKKTARELNLNGDKFDKCLDTSEQAAGVDKDLNAGKDLGITGTPTFYINGYTISGAAAYDTLRDLVQREVDASAERSSSSGASKPHASLDSNAPSQTDAEAAQTRTGIN